VCSKIPRMLRALLPPPTQVPNERNFPGLKPAALKAVRMRQVNAAAPKL